MQTKFTLSQLADPDLQEANKILRACVHCGFCTATCPTYVLLGDELDSPRGRIYLIKEMLESGEPAGKEVAKHIDRCLSCLSCMTTCPSGVHYMHLVDHARVRIEETYYRPWHERLLRRMVATVLPRPTLFRLALFGAGLLRPIAGLVPGRWGGLLRFAPRGLPGPSPLDHAGVFPAEGVRRKRVALLAGCAQRVLAPEINEATIRLLNRLGVEVVVAKEAGCCGALSHHMGEDHTALEFAKRNIDAWLGLGDLDAIVVNASGCGTVVKDYGYMLRKDAAWAEKARRVAALAKDVSEVLAELSLAATGGPPALRVAYHSACSMQHGQRIREEPRRLLAAAGFSVVEVPEGHLCCGSAGTYNLFQPELATQLRDRKIANIATTRPDVVATGNIGCITQIQSGTTIPVVHTVELLDWATGGPKPPALEKQRRRRDDVGAAHGIS
jgi:glycolate oxidase iron-sulfur subunit